MEENVEVIDSYDDEPDFDEKEWDITNTPCVTCGCSRWKGAILNEVGAVIKCDLCPDTIIYN